MSTALSITSEQEANLRKGAAYLLVGHTAMKFDMDSYCTIENLEDDHYDKEINNPNDHKCGTVGCALGHFPAAGIEPLKGEYWHSYEYRVTGLSGFESKPWDWCFGPEWKRTDNTPQGAGKRILWLLDKGLPEDWEEQQSGTSQLCYVDYVGEPA